MMWTPVLGYACWWFAVCEMAIPEPRYLFKTETECLQVAELARDLRPDLFVSARCEKRDHPDG